MKLEIEKKFLVKNDSFKKETSNKVRITQKYITSNPERSVRVRIKGNEAYITIKGIGNQSGTSRLEWEKEISILEARELFNICEPNIIDKIRYHIKYGQHIFEVDEFFGDNLGLVIAEIELSSEEENFIRPDWLGKEVTGDIKYFNSMLTKTPFSKWKHYKK